MTRVTKHKLLYSLGFATLMVVVLSLVGASVGPLELLIWVLVGAAGLWLIWTRMGSSERTE